MINLIGNLNINSYRGKTILPKPQLRTFQQSKDTVSFTGKKPVDKFPLSELNMQSIAVGKKLYKELSTNTLTPESLEMFLSSSPVPANVLPIQNLPVRAPEGTIAHMLPYYSPDILLSAAEIYMNLNADTAKKKAILCADFAHEYNHILQRSQDLSYFGIKNYTNDTQQIVAIARATQQIMNSILQKIGSNLSANREYSNARSSNCDIEYEKIKKIALNKIDLKKELDMAIKNCVENLPFEADKEKLEDVIKTALSVMLQQEIEAYKTTIATLERIGKYNQLDKNIRLTSLFGHQIIAEALQIS